MFSYQNILSMSQTRTHVVKLNEYITHTITITKARETADIFTPQGVANCNNQGLIDRKRMHCHFARAGVINTFFILYMLRDIIVLLAPNPPSENVLKHSCC